MSKRKKAPERKVNKQKAVLCESHHISQEQLIEIHAEAYYRAMKRIEREKLVGNEEEQGQKKNNWHRALSYMNVLLWPWRINKHIQLKDGIYENFVVSFISWLISVIGAGVWLTGVAIIILGIFGAVEREQIVYALSFFLVGIVMIGGGSLFVLVAKDFEKETDSNKIYAFSAFVIALAGVVVGIIALISNH